MPLSFTLKNDTIPLRQFFATYLMYRLRLVDNNFNRSVSISSILIESIILSKISYSTGCYK